MLVASSDVTLLLSRYSNILVKKQLSIESKYAVFRNQGVAALMKSCKQVRISQCHNGWFSLRVLNGALAKQVTGVGGGGEGGSVINSKL